MHPLFFYQGRSLASLAFMLLVSGPLIIATFSLPRRLE